MIFLIGLVSWAWSQFHSDYTADQVISQVQRNKQYWPVYDWVQESSDWSAKYKGDGRWEVTEIRTIKAKGLAPTKSTSTYWFYEDTGNIKWLGTKN